MKFGLSFFLGRIVWPVLWATTTGNSLVPSRKEGNCEIARVKCVYRTSCAQSLHSYMVGCADVLAGRTTRCPWACKRALISLTSSEMGLALSTCDCGDNEFCQRSKERAEVCRPEVSHATADDTVVACSVAEWICAADPLCSTALEYYHRLCRPLFHGRKCTPRCNNSLAILDRQEKAGKLRNCYCDGSEDFPCLSIKKNTHKLCYGRENWIDYVPTTLPTTVAPEDSSGCKRTAKPSVGLLIFLCFLALWHFRTSDGSVDRTATKTHLTTHCDEDDHLDLTKTRQDITSLYIIRWPWWWTSE